jgi:hypothetical protein
MKAESAGTHFYLENNVLSLQQESTIFIYPAAR